MGGLINTKGTRHLMNYYNKYFDKNSIDNVRKNTQLMAEFAISNSSLGISWKKLFLFWIWINMKSKEIAEEAVVKAKAASLPVRNAFHDYNRPTYVRVAVREPFKVNVLINAWGKLGTD